MLSERFVGEILAAVLGRPPSSAERQAAAAFATDRLSLVNYVRELVSRDDGVARYAEVGASLIRPVIEMDDISNREKLLAKLDGSIDPNAAALERVDDALARLAIRRKRGPPGLKEASGPQDQGMRPRPTKP